MAVHIRSWDNYGAILSLWYEGCSTRKVTDGLKRIFEFMFKVRFPIRMLNILSTKKWAHRPTDQSTIPSWITADSGAEKSVTG